MFYRWPQKLPLLEVPKRDMQEALDWLPDSKGHGFLHSSQIVLLRSPPNDWGPPIIKGLPRNWVWLKI